MTNGAGTYRRRVNSRVWHFCTNCSYWPNADYEGREKPPADGQLCNECLAKERNKVCKKGH